MGTMGTMGTRSQFYKMNTRLDMAGPGGDTRAQCHSTVHLRRITVLHDGLRAFPQLKKKKSSCGCGLLRWKAQRRATPISGECAAL